MSDDTVKILFDTDIGSDIDDAVALAYLLAQPRAEILGITTVSGQPVERAKLASAICKTAGQRIGWTVQQGSQTFLKPRYYPTGRTKPSSAMTMRSSSWRTRFAHSRTRLSCWRLAR